MGTQEQYPEASPRPTSIQKVMAAVAIEREGRLFVRQRPKGGVNAGFWEFPNLEVPHGVRSIHRYVATWLNVPENRLVALPPIRHAITRYRIRLESFHALGIDLPGTLGPEGRWVERGDLQTLALTAAHRRIVLSLPKADAIGC
jgi:A/G-specific adenine glycosylase